MIYIPILLHFSCLLLAGHQSHNSAHTADPRKEPMQCCQGNYPFPPGSRDNNGIISHSTRAPFKAFARSPKKSKASRFWPHTKCNVRCSSSWKSQLLYTIHCKSWLPQQVCRSDLYTYSVTIFTQILQMCAGANILLLKNLHFAMERIK